jgi:ribonuclease P/MRP protein subunit POP1
MAFPEDWPGTKAGDGEGVRMAKQVTKKWERRPDGKRESWGKALRSGERSEIGDPFSCDWQLLWKEKKGLSGEESIDAVEKIRAQAKAAMEVDSGDASTEAGQFLLSPSYAKQLLSRTSPMIATVDLTQALIPIRLRFLQKGNVSFRARIYRLPTSPEERQKWTDLLARDAAKPSKQEHATCPGEQDLLGFVTTGNMSLSEGRGRAVGALAWSRVEQGDERWIEEKEFRRWCIVRDVGMDVARLAKWEVND